MLLELAQLEVQLVDVVLGEVVGLLGDLDFLAGHLVSPLPL